MDIAAIISQNILECLIDMLFDRCFDRVNGSDWNEFLNRH